MDLSNENVVHIKNNGIEYLQCKELLNYPEVKYAYVIGLDKNFEFYPSDEEKNKITRNNFKKICTELNLNYNNLINVKQNHTDNIQIIHNKINKDKPDFNLYENTDGLITNKKGIALSTKNADCILIAFYDPIKRVIANIHSGWRGTLQRISVKAVEKMEKEYSCNPEDIICCMSPSIGKDHFEVDKDVYRLFYNEFKDINDSNIFFEKNGEKWKIDTILINREILLKQGLQEENVIDSGICSVCNKYVVHAYRAHGENAGRATQIIALI